MSKITNDLQSLAASHGLEVKDCGGGHWQVLGRGTLVNYWPESKARTAQVKGQTGVKNCLPFDVIRMAMTGGNLPKTPAAKNMVKKDMQNVDSVMRFSRGKPTNPAGIKHFYAGDVPPWDDSLYRCMAASDVIRIDAYQKKCEAEQLAFMADEQDAGLRA